MSRRLVRVAREVTVMGSIGALAALALVYGIDHAPDLNPTPPAVMSHDGTPRPDTSIDESVTVGPAVIDEDDPRFNCLTMGNHICGPGYVPVTAEQADALAEGDEAGAAPVDWRSCLIWPKGQTLVVCPDGTVVTR
jgi:hypothetical protein